MAHRENSARLTASVVFLVLWIAPTFCVYTAYYWTSPHPTIYLRLFLCTFPALIIAASATADTFSGGKISARIALSAILVGSSIWMSVAAEPKLLEVATLAWVSEEGSATARDSLPSGSLLVADSCVRCF